MKASSAIFSTIVLLATAHGYNIRGAAKNSPEGRELVAPSTFGTSLFSELCAYYQGNILFSPLSVYQALALVRDGTTAKSKTESELEQILGPQSVQNKAKSLQMQSEGKYANSGVQLSVATSIWANELKREYIYAARESQSAEALPLPNTSADVNKWVKEKTNGMIKGVLPEGSLDPLIVALLVNAVHFKGSWTYKFKRNESFNGEFTMNDGSQKRARYMTAKRPLSMISRCEALGDAQVVVLDYGKFSSSPEFSAIFIKPATLGESSMDRVISGLDSRPISELLKEVQTSDVQLELPRFRIDFGPRSLKPSLQKMGMRSAFAQCRPARRRLFRPRSSCRKFDRMSEDPWLYVDDVLHGACMEVKEEGTEAAAATAVVMKTRTARPRTFVLSFDRPFVAIIYNHETEIPLFIGRVEDPEFLFPETV